MRNVKKKTILLVLFLGAVGLVINGANASGWGYWNYVQVAEVTHACYLDVDDDGQEDDLLSEFTIRSPTGRYAYNDVIAYLYMELPSGKTLMMTFQIVEFFTELPVSVEWHNSATEPGWYTFYIVLDLYSYDIYGYESWDIYGDYLVFDPPTINAWGNPFGIVRW